jgi:hypothetical protein
LPVHFYTILSSFAETPHFQQPHSFLTLRILMSYIYGAHILDVSRSHTTTQAAHLLRSWVRIPRGAWIFVCCECRLLSGRCLCDELITRPEESYRLCCVVVCDLETSRICAPYIYDIKSLRVNDLTLILLTWRKRWDNNASKWQMGFNSGFKGLIVRPSASTLHYHV